MQTSDTPSLIPVAFANSGTKNVIPTSSSPTPGLASLEVGFPPVTMTPIVAGGIPPAGADFNGILNLLSAANRWAQAGGGYSYSASFSTAIGGYPKGAVLVNASGTGFWMSTIENNTSNPDTGGANWAPVLTNVATTTVAGIIKIASTAQAQAQTDDTTALTPKKLADAFKGTKASVASPGYQVLPSDWILQTGVAQLSGGVSVGTVFPQAFPNICVSLTATANFNNSIVAVPGLSRTGFTLTASTTSTGLIYWQAMGY